MCVFFGNFAYDMLKLPKIVVLLVAVIVLSCSQPKAKTDNSAYMLSLTMDKELGHDSATLYIVDDIYRCLKLGGLAVAQPGEPFTWQGHIDGAKAAFVVVDRDSIPFYFVLEPGEVNITMHVDRWMITGGHHNNHYMHFLNIRQGIIDAQASNFQEYLRHAADSTLTQVMEADYVRRDSLLNDSLQQYVAWRMSTDGPVALIVRERFYKTLTGAYQQRVADLK